MQAEYRKSPSSSKPRKKALGSNKRCQANAKPLAKLEKPLLSEALQLGVQLPLGAEALQEVLQGELATFATNMGLLVAVKLVENEVN
jgi:hypothetical protein